MATFTYTNGTGITITDNAVQNQTINVYGTLGTITNVSIDLSDLIHTFPDDLDMLLVGPNGTSNLEFFSDAGQGEDISGDVTFEDGAAVVPDTGPITPGTFGPSTYVNIEDDTTYGTATGGINRTDFATAFGGIGANGIWNYYLNDDAPGDNGSLASWGLTVETTSNLAEITGTEASDFIFVSSANSTDGSWNFNGDIVSFTGVTGFTLKGGGSIDTITGGNGNDIIEGGLGIDEVDGGMGDDRFIIRSGEFSDNIIGGTGIDTLDVSDRSDFALNIDLAAGTYTNQSSANTISGVENIEGTQLGDTIIGDTFNNVINSGGGDDTVSDGVGADTITLGAGNDTFVLRLGGVSDFSDPSDSIDGGADNDTFLYQGRSGFNVVFDMDAGILERVGAFTNSVTNFENFSAAPTFLTGHDTFEVRGTAGVNEITGNGNDDVIEGRGGADVLDGGNGNDTLSYEGSSAGVTVRLYQGTVSGGDADGDTISNFENVTGSAFNDVIEGLTETASVLNGGGGNDIVNGRGGVNQVSGGSGNDEFQVQTSFSEAGSSFDGGTDVDTLSIIGLAGTTDLRAVSLNSIENLKYEVGLDHSYIAQFNAAQFTFGTVETSQSLRGSETIRAEIFMDEAINLDLSGITFTGFTEPGDGVTVFGDSEEETIIGSSLNDIISGNDGDDSIEGGAGADGINGGEGYDTASYANAGAGVTIDFRTNTFTGDAAGDTFFSIEKFVGSTFGDTFNSHNYNYDLFGGGGADTFLFTGLAAGANIDGGSGVDVLDLRGFTFDGYNVNLAAGTTDEVNPFSSHTITDVENVLGTNLSDILTGDANANNLSGEGGNDTIEGGAGADMIDGGADSDTASYAGSSAGVNVTVNGAASGGDAAGDTLSNIENLLGSTFADTLTGDANDNGIEGGAGADNLDGGAGNDTLSYASSNAGVAVNFFTGSVGGGHAAGDMVSNFENIVGSNFGDFLTGDVGINTIDGLAGNDVINGSSAEDVLRGGADDDTIIGSAGGDDLNGGTGSDTLSYFNSDGAVQIDLDLGTATGAHATGDVFANFENVLGSAFADTLTGDGNANVLTGGGGVDTLDGGEGDDALVGQQGDDILISSLGADFNSGGAGSDTVDYSGSSAAVQLAIGGANTGGDAAGDILFGVENLTGSAFNDTMVGSNLANTLTGGNGNDTLNGATNADMLYGNIGDDTLIGGSGGDTLDGGVGIDTASYISSTNGVNVDLLAGTAALGDATGDSLANIENLLGSFNGNDRLTGDDGANRLDGRNGADRLTGNGGDDLLFLGNGDGVRDLAIFGASGFGNDTVAQFENGIDILDMRGLGLSFADVNVVGGANAIITFNGVSGQITMSGFNAADVDATDFFF